jgi:hypothetical protein
VRPPCDPQASHVVPDIELPEYINKGRY